MLRPQTDPLSIIAHSVTEQVAEPERENVQALIVAQLQRLHEGMLARYGLRPAAFVAWKKGRAEE
ncbi:hypothetical protein ACVBEF_00920 [Glaciimonas sp. GG7]